MKAVTTRKGLNSICIYSACMDGNTYPSSVQVVCVFVACGIQVRCCQVPSHHLGRLVCVAQGRKAGHFSFRLYFILERTLQRTAANTITYILPTHAFTLARGRAVADTVSIAKHRASPTSIILVLSVNCFQCGECV